MIPYAGADPQQARKIRATEVNGPPPRKRNRERVKLFDEVVMEAVQELPPEPPAPEFPNLDIPAMPPAMKQILFDVCRKYAVHPNDVTGLSRRSKVGMARREYCFRCKQELNKSYAHIGRTINKDHSTVIYACKMMALGAVPYSANSRPKLDCS